MALVFAVVGIEGAVRGGLAPRIGYAALAAVALVAALRALRAGVVVSEQGVVVRGFARSRRLAWDEVATVGARGSGNVTGDGRCVVIGLADGRMIRARGCSSYSLTKIERTARAIADLRPNG